LKKKESKISAFFNYFPLSYKELSKVYTPTKEETIQGTIGVLAMTALFGLFLGLSDLLCGKIMQMILT